MEKQAFDDYVTNRYSRQMGYYLKNANKNRKYYKLFQWTLIILSAITPVLASLTGITWEHDESLKTIAPRTIHVLLVAVSSIVAILTTGLKTFHYQELWIINQSTYDKLKSERYYYEFNVGLFGNEGVDKESLFVSRVETLLSQQQLQLDLPIAQSENPDN
jgi:hypothetical protein